MKQLNIPILHATLAFITGILSSTILSISIQWISAFILLLFSVLILLDILAKKWHIRSLFFGITLILLFFLIGIIAVYRANPLRIQSHYTHTLTGKPQTLLFSIQEVLKPTQYQNKFVVRLQQKDSTLSTGKLLLNIDKDPLGRLPKIGEWYYTHTAIESLPIPKNPYQFDYGTYLQKKHIYGQISLKHHELLMSSQKSKGIKVWSSRFRESVLKKIKKTSFTHSQLAIIHALLLGQRQDIDTKTNTQYANAGMMHILAVSGLHVGIILLILRFITRVISSHRLQWIRSGIIILLIWCFAFITGLSPSVLRAATMFSFIELGTILGGRRESHNALLFSALLLLLIDPGLLYHIGFQLSYLAVIAILWIQPWLYQFYIPRNYVLRILWGTITVTLAAQLGVMPLSIFYFHQFPGLFLISNSVVLPFLGIIISIGMMILCLAILDILPDVVVLYYGKIIDVLNAIIGWVSSQEAFVITHISLSLPAMLSYYLVIISVISILQKYRFQKFIMLSSAMILCSSVLFYEKSHPQNGHLVIFHKNRQSLIGSYTNHTLTIYTDDLLYDYSKDNRIQAYEDQFSIRNIEKLTMTNYLRFKQKGILIIDSLGIYQVNGLQPEYIVLSQSPNINLDRMINHYPKAVIIADGTNYKSDISRWKITCLKRKIPFHSTYEKGAFIIE